MSLQEILAIIPARSGSKSIPHKNICEVAGKPLLAWSVAHAAASQRITRIIVSTDSPDYARIARQHGAEAPFMRPENLARDETPDLPVFLHALDWLDQHEGYRPDICVHLRPTCPRRDPRMIDRMVEMLAADPKLDSVRTIAKVLHPPFKMWYRAADGMLSPVIDNLGEIQEPWNAPRQCLPATYIQTANIDVIRASVIASQRSMTGRSIKGYVEDSFLDIDTIEELDRARSELEQHQASSAPLPRLLREPRFFCFDFLLFRYRRCDCHFKP